MLLQSEEEAFDVDRPSKKRCYSPYRYSDLVEDPKILTGHSFSSPSLTTKTTRGNKKKQTFLCPMSYCQKSFHYRSVRDRHVENVHGFHGSQTKKPSPSTNPVEDGELTQPHLEKEIIEMNPEKFMWNELLGVAV